MKALVSAGHQTKIVEVRLGGTGGIGPQAAATAALRLAFKDNQGSHGWSSVYLDPIRWVPVDPLDSNSLALFGRSNYLLTDYANETPEDNHFAYHGIQGYKCDGKVVAIEGP